MAEQVCEQLRSQGVKTETLRCADYSILPGVEADMSDGDDWPKIRERVLDAEILLLSTPVWLGHPSSITQRVLERLDAELSNTDDKGRPIMYGKVALVSVVGNEDGAHKVFEDRSIPARTVMSDSVPTAPGGSTLDYIPLKSGQKVWRKEQP